ncbi:hypothetical protein QVO32_02965 [Bacteroides gallinaceum]|nr:hypothetical protein [Bacteroides gallinaceum]
MLLVLLSSCSSDEAESLYDDVLSNTRWHQFYVTPTSSITEDTVYPALREILDRLQCETRTEQETDTINKTSAESGKYLLSFGSDNKCQLEDIHHTEGTYQLATYEVKISHYPNQTYREDVGNGYTTEITVKDDSLTLRQFYGDNIVRADTIYLGENNEVRTKVRTLNVSEPLEYDFEEKSETYHMTYVRTGNKVELSGDKHLIGFINADYSKIDFDEIGSLGRE